MLRTSLILLLTLGYSAFSLRCCPVDNAYRRVVRTVDDIEKALGDRTVDRIFVPSGVYRLGSKSLRMRTGSTLECANPETTILTYEGSGSAIIFDSVSGATLTNCQIRVLSKGPAQAIIFQNTTGDNKWNLIRHVAAQGAQTELPVPGQVGLLFEASTSKALYWNVVEFLVTMNLDVGVKLTNAGEFALNGANDNTFMAITSHHCRIGMEISKHATENRVFGLSGSASGYSRENTLLIVGDQTRTPADFNMIFGLVSDQGTHGQAWRIYPGVQDTYIHGTDQSGIGSVDIGSNSVIERIGAGASSYKVPNLQHMRRPVGCTTRRSTGDSCTSPEFHWPAPFPNPNYTLTCTLSQVSGQPHIVGTHQTRFGFTVTIGNDRAEKSTGDVHCIAIADPIR
jgi:hypothetical protein